ncbi:Branched-chain-amino-acid aminotransferase [Plakobranchus ocellatus]|uniref:Branched-chain-amino-acid aminotransferase n=1 Tax=Plakobranchus ocellatus TaxID=259542 RepID=A0AAV3XUN4_9GAST|nr:Branched-chain-amino-acid aminotransferase [Plakobranchus ocellatus]
MTEVGAMNLFVYWINENGEEELITPPLDSGLILPGIVRKSLLEIARQWNEFKVSENVITMGKFVKALSDGRVKEVFGSGTAGVVCPVRQILYQDRELTIADHDGLGDLTKRFFDEINDIYYYRKPHPWMDTIDTDVKESVRTVTSN